MIRLLVVTLSAAVIGALYVKGDMRDWWNLTAQEVFGVDMECDDF